MNKLIKIHSKTTPLCFMPDGRLICYQHGDIVIFLDGNKVQSFPLLNSVIERTLGQCKLVSRFLRLGIRTAVAIDNDIAVLSIGNKLYDLNLKTKELSIGYSCGIGIRPLAFTIVSGISGFEHGVYFGGYVHNFDKGPVHIYHRIGPNDWEVVYTFSEGAINHVHNVIADPYRQCLWVFTGDFGDSAAIWRISNGFKNVERVVCGDQKWRGCIAFAVNEGILYATDAPFTKNHIYLLKEDGTTSKVANLPGSCIYGCQWQDRFVFSTAVEADGRHETPLRLLFGWKRGSGIMDTYAHMCVGNLKEGFKDVYQEKKDFWPFIFQFGAIKFPAGVNNTNTLLFQPVATRKNDMDLMGLSVGRGGL